MPTTSHLSQLIPTGKYSERIPTDTTDINCYDNDYLYMELSDLVNPQFKSWYMKCFYKLGKDRVLTLAAQARADGKQPRKLFSLLLKQAT